MRWESVWQNIQGFAQSLQESWRLRAAVFSVTAVLGVVAFFALSSGGDGYTAAEAVAVLPGEKSAESGNRGQVEGVEGESMTEDIAAGQADALGVSSGNLKYDKKDLRDPFLHPVPKAKAVVSAKSGPVNKQDVQEKEASSSAPVAEEKATVQSVTEPPGGNLQLQGIINEGANKGVLVTVDGSTRFLLQGEGGQGYLLEDVTGEKARLQIGGRIHELKVGERVAVS